MSCRLCQGEGMRNESVQGEFVGRVQRRVTDWPVAEALQAPVPPALP